MLEILNQDSQENLKPKNYLFVLQMNPQKVPLSCWYSLQNPWFVTFLNLFNSEIQKTKFNNLFPKLKQKWLIETVKPVTIIYMAVIWIINIQNGLPIKQIIQGTFRTTVISGLNLTEKQCYIFANHCKR